MPLLASWLTSLFAGLASWFAGFMTMRAAFIAAGIATFGGMVATLYGVMAALVSTAAYAFPSGGLIATGIWLFVPDNTPAALSIMIAADTALALFFWQNVNLKMAMRGAS